MEFSTVKNIWDIIYMNDEDVGLNSEYPKDRPYLIIGYQEDSDIYELVPLTTRRKYEEYSQINLSTGSNINLPIEGYFITSRYVIYAEISKEQLSGEDIWKIENILNN